MYLIFNKIILFIFVFENNSEITKISDVIN